VYAVALEPQPVSRIRMVTLAIVCMLVLLMAGTTWAAVELAGSTTTDAGYVLVLTAWFTAFVAVGTVVLDLLTLRAMWTQDERARLSQGIELINKFSDEWNSARLKQSRATISRLIRNGRADEAIADTCLNEVSAILDLFQDLAFFVRRGVLDGEHVWSAFGEVILAYYWSLRVPITESRRSTPTKWGDLEDLFRIMDRLEHSQSKKFPKGAKLVTPNQKIVGLPDDYIKNEFLPSEERLWPIAEGRLANRRQRASLLSVVARSFRW
jgi:hypothetical protein